MKTCAALREKDAHAIDDCSVGMPTIVSTALTAKTFLFFFLFGHHTEDCRRLALPTAMGHWHYFTEFRPWSILNVSLHISSKITLKLPTPQQNFEYEIIIRRIFHPILVLT